MTLRERVVELVRALPPDGAAFLPVAALERWLQEDESAGGVTRAASGSGASLEVDLTVEGVAKCLGVGRSRARDIIRENQEALGAYKRGRRWYVRVSGLASWQDEQAAAYRPGGSMGSLGSGQNRKDIDFDALRREL